MVLSSDLPVYFFTFAYGSGLCGKLAGSFSRGISGDGVAGGRRSKARIGFWRVSVSLWFKARAIERTWSEVVYPGMLVYKMFLIFEVSAVSLCVAYNILSVHEGVRLVLYLSTSPNKYL